MFSNNSYIMMMMINKGRQIHVESMMDTKEHSREQRVLKNATSSI